MFPHPQLVLVDTPVSSVSHSIHTHNYVQHSDSGIPSTGIADLDKVKTLLSNLVDWQSLGLKLGLLYPTLEKIEIDHRGMVEQCKTKMLAAWLQQQDNVRQYGSPSWSVLQAALRSMGENRLASEINM